MFDERFGPLPEYLNFFLDQFFVVINAFRSVTADIVFDTIVNVFRRAIENNKSMNVGYLRHVLCLPRMPGDSVQDKNVLL